MKAAVISLLIQSLSLLPASASIIVIRGPVLYPAAGGGGTPAWVQDDGANFDPFNASRSVTFSSSTTSGNCILVFYRGANQTSISATDNKSNSYSVATTGATSGISAVIATNITGGASHQVTVTVTSHSNPGFLIALEFSGVASASAVDGTPGQVSSFVTDISTNLTTSVNNTMLVGCMYSGAGGATAGSGFTLRHAEGVSLQSETKVGATSGTNAVGFTHSERTAELTAIALKPQ